MNDRAEYTRLWRENNPDKVKAQRERYKARIRGEDVPYLAKQRKSLEEQQEYHKNRHRLHHERVKKRLAEDPEYAAAYRAKSNERSHKRYRRLKGLPEDAVLRCGGPRLSEEEKAAREARKAEEKAIKLAERERQKLIRAQEKKAAKESARKARVEKIRRKRAEEVAAAKEKAAQAKAETSVKPFVFHKPRMGRLSALRRWNRL
jgi:hypothetical protein